MWLKTKRSGGTTSTKTLFEDEHDLARHASLPNQFLRLSCLGKGESPRDERLDLLLVQKVEQGDRILSKHRRLQAFEPLDAGEGII